MYILKIFKFIIPYTLYRYYQLFFRTKKLQKTQILQPYIIRICIKYMITPKIEVKNPVFCRRHEAQNIKTKI